MKYLYGMRLRPFSIGCQPTEGFIERCEITLTGKCYHDILAYERPLTKKELDEYEMDYLWERES